MSGLDGRLRLAEVASMLLHRQVRYFTRSVAPNGTPYHLPEAKDMLLRNGTYERVSQERKCCYGWYDIRAHRKHCSSKSLAPL